MFQNLRIAVFTSCLISSLASLYADEPATIRHSYLVVGAKTAIINEEGTTDFEYSGGSRDGFVLPNGNVLLAYSDRVEE